MDEGILSQSNEKISEFFTVSCENLSTTFRVCVFEFLAFLNLFFLGPFLKRFLSQSNLQTFVSCKLDFVLFRRDENERQTGFRQFDQNKREESEGIADSNMQWRNSAGNSAGNFPEAQVHGLIGRVWAVNDWCAVRVCVCLGCVSLTNQSSVERQGRGDPRHTRQQGLSTAQRI